MIPISLPMIGKRLSHAGGWMMIAIAAASSTKLRMTDAMNIGRSAGWTSSASALNGESWASVAGRPVVVVVVSNLRPGVCRDRLLDLFLHGFHVEGCAFLHWREL